MNTFRKRNIMYIVHSYVAYLVLSLAVTIWVARTLHKNGRVFLIHAFRGDQELADSINHLLVVGFYLINLGYVALALQAYGVIDTPRQAIELVSDKVGRILLVLGAMHFLNLYVFNRLRRRGQEPSMPPPLPPNTRLPGPLPAGTRLPLGPLANV
jgi:hypothetical protein